VGNSSTNVSSALLISVSSSIKTSDRGALASITLESLKACLRPIRIAGEIRLLMRTTCSKVWFCSGTGENQSSSRVYFRRCYLKLKTFSLSWQRSLKCPQVKRKLSSSILWYLLISVLQCLPSRVIRHKRCFRNAFQRAGSCYSGRIRTPLRMSSRQCLRRGDERAAWSPLWDWSYTTGTTMKIIDGVCILLQHTSELDLWTMSE